MSNVEPATTVSSHNYSPNMAVEVKHPEPVAPAAKRSRKYPSRNMTAVKRLDSPHSFRGSYDDAMIKYMCIAQVVEKHEKKRLTLHKGLKV